jgi:formamidopyrimidine-DNA glycosylase
MPELPEVETSCRGIAPHLTHRQVSEVRIHQTSLRYPVSPEIGDTLVGKTIQQVSRRGKYILLTLETGSILIHLGMSGSLRILEKGFSQPLRKHDHVQFFFSHGVELRYHDPRRFGLILWAENHQHPLLDKIGMEPLSDAFNADWLLELCQKKTTEIKPLLMTSHLITGVGNIYANESLFYAGIHPQTAANKLSAAQVKRLHETLVKTLKRAIEQGGSTLRDFVNTQGEPGYFAQTLAVYGRLNQPCLSCHTPIEKILQAQRASYFCPQCQPAVKKNPTATT